MKVRKYFVTVPFRGEDYYLVPARSAAEAKRKVSEMTDDVDSLDWQPTRRYEPSHAEPDEAREKGGAA